MHYLFIDESGELGINAGSSEFFLITALCTENLKALEKRVWKEKAKLINAGWPKDIEIKGTSIWGSPHNPRIPKPISERREVIMGEILTSLSAGPNKVHYSIAKKKHLSSHIMKAEYGIAYNFLCGTLLCRAYPKHFAGPLEIVVDQRSKETHSKMKFDGYVETRLIGDCQHETDLVISHAESHDVPGLQAVDFLSWALFRKYEKRQPQFADMIKSNIGYCDDWYSTKK
jgi:Protein of unknown function (DUF3800)